MFSSFAKPFHKNDKSLSEKGLDGIIYYTGKSSRDIAQFAEDNRLSANSLMAYGSLLGDDFNDVTNKLGNILIQWSNIMMEFSDSIDQYRNTLKMIPIKEASLQPGREQKRKLREKMDQLQGSLSSMDKLAYLEDQLQQLEKVTELDEIEINNYKRLNTSKALYTLLDGMKTMANKTSIISNSSKYIVDELNVTPLKIGQEKPIYKAEEKTRNIINHIQKSLDQPIHQNNYYTPTTTIIPIKSTSTPSSITTKTNNNNTIIIPPRNISLEEQNKQYSFHKPNEIPSDDEQEEESDLSPPLVPKKNFQNYEAGFSNIYLNTHHQYPQQDHYLPNKEYEELASSYNSGAVFRANRNDNRRTSQRLDAGGFVLPSFNPNYMYPSTSTQSVNSSKSDSATE